MPAPPVHLPGWWAFHLRPALLAAEVARVARKVSDRLRRPGLAVASLAARGERRGRALLSFWIAPFLLPADVEPPHTHTAFWESREIGRILAGLGYDVDVIDWTNDRFVPQGRYEVIIDARLNLERLAPHVAPSCRLVQHMETAHHRFHNAAQRRRLAELAARRGVRLKPRRLIEENRAVEVAHAGITTGNAFTEATYAFAGKPIWRVPVSTALTYPWPAGKDFDGARRRWLWFGSGGLVHKGLDRVLEAFAGMPEHQLVVCGPVHLERDFVAAYARELFATPNIRLAGWLDVAGPTFRELAAASLGVVYPSCAEGGGGSVVTCMQAALLPVVTREASIDTGDFGVLLPDAEVAGIRRAVRLLAAEPPACLAQRARAAYEHARRHHTRPAYAASYRRALAAILGLGPEAETA